MEDAYLFGPDLYVAPVMEDHVTEREVYLPAGTTWFNAWTGGIDDGGKKINMYRLSDGLSSCRSRRSSVY